MNNQNQVNITGRLGKDAEYRSFNNGGGVCNFSVAVSKTWFDKNSGEKKEHTEWVPVSNFKKGADKLTQYLRKGQFVRVCGEFRTRSWEQDGITRYKSEVVVQGFNTEIELLGGDGNYKPNNNNQPNNQPNNNYQRQPNNQPPQFNDNTSGNSVNGGGATDDDIPFNVFYGGE